MSNERAGSEGIAEDGGRPVDTEPAGGGGGGASGRRSIDARILAAIPAHVRPELTFPHARIVVIAKLEDCAAWSRALRVAGATVRVERDIAELRSGPDWISADLVVLGTPRAVHGELADPDAPPFIAVCDALIAGELVALLRAGARDVLVRPVAPGELVAACARVLARGWSRPARVLAPRMRELPVGGPTGAAISRTRMPVMMIGETGSGKTRLGRLLHDTLTPHAPFVELNASALPGDRLISELFGRDAASDGAGSQRGLVAAANGGTLFLDEIGELGPDTQAQLLAFLDTGLYRPAGAVRAARSDTRVFTATHRDLEAAVAQGRFRADLYHRLASIVVPLAPLRDQRGRLPVLVDELLHDAAERAGDVAPQLGDDATLALAEHRWPGNVRQLQFAIERLVAMWPGQRIGADEVRMALGPAEPVAGSPPVAPARDTRSLVELERDMVERAMREARGNRTRAAELLGITPRGLYNRLRRIASRDRSSD